MNWNENAGRAALAWMQALNFPREAGSESEKSAAERIAQEAGRCADAVSIEPFLAGRREGDRMRSISSQNVAAILHGTERREECLVLSAHYDSVPCGPGAYDNLSSCAVMLQLLSCFSKNRPERTLRFLWFGAEELGLVGSQAYVRRHASDLASCLFAVNSDLCGQEGGPDVFGLTGGEEAASYLRALFCRSEKKVTVKRKVWASDSNAFAAAGIPAMTYDRDGYGMHTPEDTLERISERALSDAVFLVGTAAEELARADPFPFPRAMPEDMQVGLRAYFARKNAGLKFYQVDEAAKEIR